MTMESKREHEAMVKDLRRNASKYEALVKELRRHAKKSLTPKEQREGAISFTMGMMGPDNKMTREEVADHFDNRYGKI